MTRALTPLVAACLIAVAALLTPALADDATNKPATQAALPACCSDACKKMDKCCTADDNGKATCSMGGNCCTQPAEKKDDKKADDKNKGMSGMDMGK